MSNKNFKKAAFGNKVLTKDFVDSLKQKTTFKTSTTEKVEENITLDNFKWKFSPTKERPVKELRKDEFLLALRHCKVKIRNNNYELEVMQKQVERLQRILSEQNQQWEIRFKFLIEGAEKFAGLVIPMEITEEQLLEMSGIKKETK